MSLTIKNKTTIYCDINEIWYVWQKITISVKCIFIIYFWNCITIASIIVISNIIGMRKLSRKEKIFFPKITILTNPIFFNYQRNFITKVIVWHIVGQTILIALLMKFIWKISQIYCNIMIQLVILFWKLL